METVISLSHEPSILRYITGKEIDHWQVILLRLSPETVIRDLSINRDSARNLLLSASFHGDERTAGREIAACRFEQRSAKSTCNIPVIMMMKWSIKETTFIVKIRIMMSSFFITLDGSSDMARDTRIIYFTSLSFSLYLDGRRDNWLFVGQDYWNAI